MTESLSKSLYADFFQALADVEQTYLIADPILAPHKAYYTREMRIKAYTQLLESYRSLTIERMCRSFGVSEQFMDRDLSRFIASGRLNCRIDKVSGVVTTNKLESVGKSGRYEALLKQGDLLLNGQSAKEKLSCVCSSDDGIKLTAIQTFRSYTVWLDRALFTAHHEDRHLYSPVANVSDAYMTSAFIRETVEGCVNSKKQRCMWSTTVTLLK